MNRLIIILSIVSLSLVFQSCKPDEPKAGFEDMLKMTIFDYIAENEDMFSKFKQILEVGGLDKTMGAYNPNGNDYTIFLPTNSAIDAFIERSSTYNTFDDLLKDKKYVAAMARYHVVNMGIITNDFPFGALPELNLTGQYLTIGFEMGEDSSYYKINNFAPLIFGNIEVSNGWVHIISEALTPITFTTFQWLEQNPAFSIFFEAVKATGYDEVLSRVIDRDSVGLNPVTLFAEPDTVYNRYKIYSFADLATYLKALDADYTNLNNAVNNYVGYHILEGSWFLSNFEGRTTNYNTYGSVPVDVNGEGIDLLINRNKIITDTIISSTNEISYKFLEVTFYYDFSNVLTQSGAVHVINQVMTVQQARPRTVNFEFFDEPLFATYREKSGEYLIEERDMLRNITWTGGNDRLLFVKNDVPSEQAWNRDYLMIEGDFSITYRLPRVVAGTYEFFIRAHAFSSQNALVEVFFDGVKIGGLIDLTALGNQNYPYSDIRLGTLNLLSYDRHEVTVRSLIPGVFKWDVVMLRIPQ